MRELLDGPGNDVSRVRALIDQGAEAILSGSHLVVCCDYGASRSNAVAAGIMALSEKMTIDEAFRRVVAATGESDIKLDLYLAVKRSIDAAGSLPSDRRIVVLGGGGFIGSRWKALGERDVVFLQREDADLAGDLTSIAARLADLGATDLVCLAQPARPFGKAMVGRSTEMTYGALELARTLEIRLTIPSSISVFAGAPDGSQLGTQDHRKPRDDFGCSKAAAEELALGFAQSRGARVSIVRFAHVYGAHNLRPAVLTNAMPAIREGRDIRLRRYENGLPALDLLFIDDAVRALSHIVRSATTGLLHVGSGTTTQIFDAIQTAITVLGSSSTVTFDDYKGETRRLILSDVDKLVFGTHGCTPLGVGIEALARDTHDQT
ncbi:MAG: NAD(P)-dependent oxidoreductase [Hyphomicrobiales bacterium]|nr:NAD(P)-dependent oxidoreductase [Hyphomicrobiales bacterium]